MKKNLLLLTVLLAAAFFPGTSRGAAGYLYESDNSTGTIFQFTTTTSGTVVKITFATGLTGVRGLAFDHAGNLFVGQDTTIVRITPEGLTSVFASGLHGPNFLAVDQTGNLSCRTAMAAPALKRQIATNRAP
jgi:putative intracellular protease/amidase